MKSTSPLQPSISLNDGEISKFTALGTVGTTVTAPEVTSTINEQGHCSNALLQVLLVLQLPLQKRQVLSMNIPRKSPIGAPICP